jgi:hypothetical protein
MTTKNYNKGEMGEQNTDREQNKHFDGNSCYRLRML